MYPWCQWCQCSGVWGRRITTSSSSQVHIGKPHLKQKGHFAMFIVCNSIHVLCWMTTNGINIFRTFPTSQTNSAPMTQSLDIPSSSRPRVTSLLLLPEPIDLFIQNTLYKWAHTRIVSGPSLGIELACSPYLVAHVRISSLLKDGWYIPCFVPFLVDGLKRLSWWETCSPRKTLPNHLRAPKPSFLFLVCGCNYVMVLETYVT